MIYLFEGELGCGKSTVAAALCYRDYKKEGRRIISTAHLNFPFEKFTLEDFVGIMAEEGTPLENCSIWFDEAQQLIDSRDSATKQNKLFTYFFAQARKRRVDVYICTHSIDNLDKRVRRLIQWRGRVHFRDEMPCKKCAGVGTFQGQTCERCLDSKDGKFSHGGWITVDLYNRFTHKHAHLKPLWGPRLWSLFDSYERTSLLARQVSGIETQMVGGGSVNSSRGGVVV